MESHALLNHQPRHERREREKERTFTSLKCPAKILSADTLSVLQSLAVRSLLAVAK